MRWLNQHREEMKKKVLTSSPDMSGKELMTAIAKRGGDTWNAMTEEQKAPYVTEYKKEKESFDAAMVAYKATIIACMSSPNENDDNEKGE
jgi:hypothetical protein